MVLAGWVLDREESGHGVDAETFRLGAKRLYGVSLSPATTSRYIDRWDISTQLVSSRSSSRVVSRDTLVSDALEWYQEYHKQGFGTIEPHKLWCIDSTTDSTRLERPIILGKKNGGQRKVWRVPRTHTSSIYVMVNAVGQQVGPAIATYDDMLNLEGPNQHNVRRCLKQRGLRAQDLYYVPNDKYYCKENRDMYSSFLNDIGNWGGHRVLSDAARFFSVRGENLFLDLGFEDHMQFVPSAHGQISIIDGYINGTAKATWRKSREAVATQWESTLLLASEILHVAPRDSAMAWERHMLVGGTPDHDMIERFLFPKEHKNEARLGRWQKCVEAYYNAELEDGWDKDLHRPDAIDSKLDGQHWRVRGLLE